jgi:hypothetical protein
MNLPNSSISDELSKPESQLSEYKVSATQIPEWHISDTIVNSYTIEDNNIEDNIGHIDDISPKNTLVARIRRKISSLFPPDSYTQVQGRYKQWHLPVISLDLQTKSRQSLYSLSCYELSRLLYSDIVGENLNMNNMWNISTAYKKQIWIEAIKNTMEERIIESN